MNFSEDATEEWVHNFNCYNTINKRLTIESAVLLVSLNFLACLLIYRLAPALFVTVRAVEFFHISAIDTENDFSSAWVQYITAVFAFPLNFLNLKIKHNCTG